MWTDFFMTAAGASAALAGLVFVALSVNIAHILRYPNLPSRAAATIGSLILILVSCMAALIHQPIQVLGIEILIFGLGGCWLQFVSARRGFVASPSRRPVGEAIFNAVMGGIQVLPFILAGLLLIAGLPSGLYLMAAGCIAIFILSVLNAWVLLVEILR
jgi:modulator of FtsH protease